MVFKIKMDTNNLHLTYFTDTVTFSRTIIVSGADPSHTKDMRTLGGVFHCYLDGGKRGWVFGNSKDVALQNYIKTGHAIRVPKKNILEYTAPAKKDHGICKRCKTSIKLDNAVKSYLRFYAGGLPEKVTGMLMDAEYRNKISTAFEKGTFVCTTCMRTSDAAKPTKKPTRKIALSRYVPDHSWVMKEYPYSLKKLKELQELYPEHENESSGYVIEIVD